MLNLSSIHRKAQALRTFVALGAILLVGPLAPQARADVATNREVVRIYANYYLQEKNYAELEKFLGEHLADDPGDGESWNLLGLAYLELDRLGDGARAFYRAASATEGELKGVYLYHYATALARAGDQARAKQVLETAMKYEIVAEVAEEAIENLKKRKSLPELEFGRKSVWDGKLTLGNGYDTNVLLVSDASRSSLTPTELASPFVLVAPQIGLRKDALGGRLDVDYGASAIFQTTQSARRFSNLYSKLDVFWGSRSSGTGSVSWSVGNQADTSFIADDGVKFFHWSEGLAFRSEVNHGSGAETVIEIPARYRVFREDADQPENDRSGWALNPSLTHKRRWGVSAFSLGLEYERVWAQGENFQAHTLSIPVLYARQIGTKWSVSAAGEVGLLYFTESTSDRDDKYINLSFSMGRSLWTRWQGTMQYLFERNTSTADSAMYSKHAVMLLMNYALF